MNTNLELFIYGIERIHTRDNLTKYLWENNITREELMTMLNFTGTKNEFNNKLLTDKYLFNKVKMAAITIYSNKINNNTIKR